MRWKPIPEQITNIVVAPVGLAVAIAFVPIILGAVALSWLQNKAFPPPSHDWHRWFAWRPVKSGRWSDKNRQWLWLESIERRGQPHSWETEYRVPEGQR